jgi:uncharacterized protein DUF3761/uncharacterized protein DUF2510
MTQPRPDAGWYPDGHGQLRYWNGTAWTASSPAATPVPNHPARPPKRPVWPWLVMGLFGVCVLAAVGISALTAPSKHTASESTLGTSPVVPSASAFVQTTSTPSPSTPSSPGTPVETTGGVTVNGAGAVLPDPLRTPGATNPSVNQNDIDSTICVSGWTATVRPSSTYTTDLKVKQLDSGYAYRGDTNTGDYEEDHLISLEIGGSPTSELNLWPEPYNSADGARVKDVVENKLHDLVCAGSISLATAQQAIAGNWWTAYVHYVGAPPSTHPPAAATHASPAPPPVVRTSAAAGPPNGATALCKDGTYSYAAHHQGACSSHGGVAVFYN